MPYAKVVRDGKTKYRSQSGDLLNLKQVQAIEIRKREKKGKKK